MKLVIVAHAGSETNDALAAAAASLGLPARVQPPRAALRMLEPADVALGRLAVAAELDGIEPGLRELEQIAAGGATVLNPPSALVAAHDKHLTARLLRRAGVPHPRTWLAGEGTPSPAPELPVTVLPRFGSWGEERRCETADELAAVSSCDVPLVAHEIVPAHAPDVRLVVAGRRVIAASAPSPPLVHRLAIEAAATLGCDLLDVTVRTRAGGYVVAAVDAAVELHQSEALNPGCLFRTAVHELTAVAFARRPAA